VTTKVIANGMSLPLAYFRLAIAGMPFVVIAGTIYYVLIERPCMVPNWPNLVFQHFSRKLNGSHPAPSAIAESSGK
jgi:hypothetical protein